MAKIKHDLDLSKLEIFYWVAELKSFSQAAKRLSLAQPTVSAHVRELEKTLAGKLFYRIPGKVSLTPLGQLLMDRARNLLALKRETIAAVEQFQGNLSGELWIGGSNIPGEYLLPVKLGGFIKRYPEVKPILRIGDSAGIVQEVLDGKVEMGYVGFKIVDERLSYQKIWRDEMLVAVPAGHRWKGIKAIQLRDLRSERFISRERGSGTLDSFRRLLGKRRHSPDVVLNVAMELGSTEAVKEAVIAGLGISILSRTSIRREIESGLIVPVRIKGLGLERDFYQVFHNRRPLSPAAQAFRQFLKTS